MSVNIERSKRRSDITPIGGDLRSSVRAIALSRRTVGTAKGAHRRANVQRG